MKRCGLITGVADGYWIHANVTGLPCKTNQRPKQTKQNSGKMFQGLCIYSVHHHLQNRAEKFVPEMINKYTIKLSKPHTS